MSFLKSKFLITSILFSLFAFSTQAQTFDVSKFKSKGKAVCENLLGKNNIIGHSNVIFRDGTGAMDLEPLYDYASYIYAVTPKAGVLPRNNLMLGYRLQLNGQEDVVLLQRGAHDSEIMVAMAGSGVATLREDVTTTAIEILVAQLKILAPSAEFQVLDLVGVLTFNATILEGPKVFQALSQSSLVLAVELDYENYRIPFVFDPVIEVTDAGMIDADKYRQLTKTLKEQGLVFASETTVPSDLQ